MKFVKESWARRKMKENGNKCLKDFKTKSIDSKIRWNNEYQLVQYLRAKNQLIRSMSQAVKSA